MRKSALVMMFRDEGDILERCLQHWINCGIDTMYLCDNGSVDNSPAIAKKYTENVVHDGRTNWPGREVINKLKAQAIKDGYEWIFPVDADEFVHLGEFENINQWISTYPDKYGWGEVKYLNILPNGKSDWQEPHRKCFGKLKADWTICMGNHFIENAPHTLDSKGVYYEHYSLRTFEQFKQKMINYMTAFHQSPFQTHPRAVDYHNWKRDGDEFLMSRWNSLINMLG